MRAFICCACCLLLPIAAPAETVQTTLPLEGYYRPGKFMPLRISGPVARGEAVELRASGAITTVVVAAAPRIDVVVPWLVMAAQDEAASSLATFPLRPLAADARLVGFTQLDLELASLLFPGRSIIPVRLDAADPLPGHSAAWSTLDAVFLDAFVLDEQAIRALLSAATTIAVRSDDAPDANWPWRKMRDWWVLQLDPSGPSVATFSDVAYAPVATWRIERPLAFRRAVLLWGTLFTAVAISLSLWRGRALWIGMLVLSAVTVAAIVTWSRLDPAIIEAGGDVRTVHHEMLQRDRWQYQASLRTRRYGIAWRDLTWPVPASSSHLEQMQLQLHCRSDGSPAGYSYHLPRGSRIAFLQRDVVPEVIQHTHRLPVTSPIHTLLPPLYLRPDVGLTGEADADTPARWPAVILHRQPHP